MKRLRSAGTLCLSVLCLVVPAVVQVLPHAAAAQDIPRIIPSESRKADLVIALLPERNVFEQKKRYGPLEDYLAERLGMSVYFKLIDSYQGIFLEIREDRVDGGFFGSMNGAIALSRGEVVPLARPVWLDGSSTYNGYIFTRRGSGITADSATWKGKSVAFVNKATTAGYLYPMSLLRGAGVTGEPESYFSHVTYTGSHDAAILSVFAGDSDFGACKNTVFTEFMQARPDVEKEIVILAQSPHVPSNGLGVSTRLPEEKRERIKSTLLEMHGDVEGRDALRALRALKFIETGVKDYQPVLDMAEKTGIDLAAWPLRDMR